MFASTAQEHLTQSREKDAASPSRLELDHIDIARKELILLNMMLPQKYSVLWKEGGHFFLLSTTPSQWGETESN